jgi:hypothetical protein
VGDLVLARVDAIGNHAALQLVNGRRRHLFPGDEIVVAYGHRYASNQFESEVPESLGPCHLVAGGGIASRALSWHVKISKGPTQITPIGLLAGPDDIPINLKDFALDPVPQRRDYRPTSIAVVGTSMDAGKTQTCVHLVRGLVGGGLRVGYAKVTGTGAGGDFWWLRDAGADPVLDFTDVGLPSTYLMHPNEVQRVLVTLANHIATEGVDAMVLEIADGIFQGETAALLSSSSFQQTVGGIVLAAADSMGAAAGYEWLCRNSFEPVALSGLLTVSPLQAREALTATGLQSLGREQLATPRIASALLGQAQRRMDAQITHIRGGA